MGLRAGRLNKAVDLYSPAVPGGGHGNPNPGFNLAASNVRAGVENLRGREFFDAQQVNSEAKLKVVMRYQTDITANWQIEHSGRRFDLIAPPLSDKKRNETVCYCRELT